MVQQHLNQHPPVTSLLRHRQVAAMESSIGVSGPGSLPPVSCVGMDDPRRDPTDP